MINGVHALIYTRTPDAVRGFFRDVLGLRSVDAGQGWLIFARLSTSIRVPDDTELGLYQPRHPTAIGPEPSRPNPT